MNHSLQFTFIITSITFFIFIIRMIKINTLDLRYSFIWISTSLVFILLSTFPKILNTISEILNIYNPVNALFLVINFFVLINLFTLTIALSKNINRVKTIIQELGITNLELKKFKEKLRK
jgi:hypothetical protein